MHNWIENTASYNVDKICKKKIIKRFPDTQLDLLILKLLVLKTLLIPRNFTLPLQFRLQNSEIFCLLSSQHLTHCCKTYTVSSYISPECKVCTSKLSLTSAEAELTILSSKLEAKALFNSSSSAQNTHIRRINNVWRKDNSAFYDSGYSFWCNLFYYTGIVPGLGSTLNFRLPVLLRVLRVCDREMWVFCDQDKPLTAALTYCIFWILSLI